MITLIFLLASAGLTMILVKSKIFKPLREYISKKKIEKNGFWIYLEDVFSCGICMGVYTSVIVYVFIFNTINWQLIPHIFAGALVSSVFISLNQYLDRK